MKNLIKITFAMALSAMLFFSCSKDELITKNQEKVKITLSADKDGIASKTAAIEGETSFSYIWTNEDVDNIKLFTVSGSTITEVANPTITKVSDKQLTITAEVNPGQTYTFRAILCNPASYTGTGSDYSQRNPKIASNQWASGTSSFDPNADILVSDDLVVDVAEGGNTTADLNLKFRHKVVGNKMTLKNLTVGEKISKVVISSDKDLTGYLEDGVMVGDGKKITVTYNNLEVPEGGQLPVYFISMANSGQILNVEVTTDKNTYTKTFTRTIDLILGQFTRFGVALPEGTPTLLTTYYQFTAKDWSATPQDWTSGKDGNGFSNSGIQVSKNDIGVNGTSPVSFTGVTKVVVTYNTNKNKGSGSFDLKIGNNAVHNKSCGYSGSVDGTTAFFTTTFDLETPEDGAVNLKVNTTTNSIYVVSVEITSRGSEAGTYTVTCADTENGTISASPFSAPAGTEVVLSSTPAPGYKFKSGSWVVKDANNNTIVVDENKFIMPASNVTVSAEFVEEGTVIDYSLLNSSNVQLKANSTTGAIAVKVAVSGTEYDAIKLGGKNTGGSMVVTIPEGSTKLHIHAAAWNGDNNTTLTLSGITPAPNPSSIGYLNDDEGFSGSGSTFILQSSPTEFYYEVSLSGISIDKQITITSSRRVVVWGVNVE